MRRRLRTYVSWLLQGAALGSFISAAWRADERGQWVVTGLCCLVAGIIVAPDEEKPGE